MSLGEKMLGDQLEQFILRNSILSVKHPCIVQLYPWLHYEYGERTTKEMPRDMKENYHFGEI